MKKIKTSLDLIEKAKQYSLLAKNNLEKAVAVGNRKKLGIILMDVPPSMIIATYGTAQRCIILIDYEFGDLMDLITQKRHEV